MKYKITIIIISLIAILVLLYMFVLKCNRKLPEQSGYKIVSNTGIIIPAKLYSRIVKSNIDGNEKTINEFILCFNDSLISNKLNMSGDEKLYKYIVIVPDLKVIGLVNHAKSLKEKDTYICQTGYEADSFTSMINNHTFYSTPPINEASFTREKIVFNTYGILKQFGDSIVIETNTKKRLR